ncbi:MAG: hypothetical protein ABIO70_10385 [Pseudomonadota bacterium]
MVSAGTTPVYPQPDADEIRRAIDILHEPGAVFELRILRLDCGGVRKRNRAGFFTDHHRAAAEAARWSGRADGVYVTFNQIRPELLDRATNLTVEGRKALSAQDSDVVRRRWLFIDIDPKRPAGHSATQDEKQSAVDLAREVRDWLEASGFPAPVLADSGNGAHLLYRIDLPAEDGGLVGSILKSLSHRFGRERAEVDPRNKNPSRILKLYGTIARKGAHSEDRPHRVARILESPTELLVVPDAVLRSVVAMAASASIPPGPRAGESTEPPSFTSATQHSEGGFDLDAWIARHSLDVGEPKE